MTHLLIHRATWCVPNPGQDLALPRVAVVLHANDNCVAVARVHSEHRRVDPRGCAHDATTELSAADKVFEAHLFRSRVSPALRVKVKVPVHRDVAVVSVGYRARAHDLECSCCCCYERQCCQRCWDEGGGKKGRSQLPPPLFPPPPPRGCGCASIPHRLVFECGSVQQRLPRRWWSRFRPSGFGFELGQ